MGATTEAIVIRQYGGPDVMVLESVDVPAPGPGQILLKQQAASVNFHDVYVRSGAYKTLPLPGIPGLEAVGTVEAVGAGVRDFAPGDRVAYIDRAYGGYARARVVDAGIVPLLDVCALPPQGGGQLSGVARIDGGVLVPGR